MHKIAVYALAAMLGLPISAASAAQSHQKPSQIPPTTQAPSALGFSTLVCTADGTGGAYLPGTFTMGIVTVTGTAGDPTTDGFPTMLVLIDNGYTSKSYVVTYIDENNSGTLNCGDRIISVIHAS